MRVILFATGEVADIAITPQDTTRTLMRRVSDAFGGLMLDRLLLLTGDNRSVQVREDGREHLLDAETARLLEIKAGAFDELFTENAELHAFEIGDALLDPSKLRVLQGAAQANRERCLRRAVAFYNMKTARFKAILDAMHTTEDECDRFFRMLERDQVRCAPQQGDVRAEEEDRMSAIVVAPKLAELRRRVATARNLWPLVDPASLRDLVAPDVVSPESIIEILSEIVRGRTTLERAEPQAAAYVDYLRTIRDEAYALLSPDAKYIAGLMSAALANANADEQGSASRCVIRLDQQPANPTVPPSTFSVLLQGYLTPVELSLIRNQLEAAENSMSSSLGSGGSWGRGSGGGARGGNDDGGAAVADTLDTSLEMHIAEVERLRAEKEQQARLLTESDALIHQLRAERDELAHQLRKAEEKANALKTTIDKQKERLERLTSKVEEEVRAKETALAAVEDERRSAELRVREITAADQRETRERVAKDEKEKAEAQSREGRLNARIHDLHEKNAKLKKQLDEKIETESRLREAAQRTASDLDAAHVEHGHLRATIDQLKSSARESEAARAREAQTAQAHKARSHDNEVALTRDLEAARERALEAARARDAEATRAREAEAALERALEAVRARDAEATRAREADAVRAREVERFQHLLRERDVTNAHLNRELGECRTTLVRAQEEIDSLQAENELNRNSIHRLETMLNAYEHPQRAHVGAHDSLRWQLESDQNVEQPPQEQPQEQPLQPLQVQSQQQPQRQPERRRETIPRRRDAYFLGPCEQPLEGLLGSMKRTPTGRWYVNIFHVSTSCECTARFFAAAHCEAALEEEAKTYVAAALEDRVQRDLVWRAMDEAELKVARDEFEKEELAKVEVQVVLGARVEDGAHVEVIYREALQTDDYVTELARQRNALFLLNVCPCDP